MPRFCPVTTKRSVMYWDWPMNWTRWRIGSSIGVRPAQAARREKRRGEPISVVSVSGPVCFVASLPAMMRGNDAGLTYRVAV
jgi:hypothetical protein